MAAGDYTSGPLEDWVAGALAFDGSRTATLSHADITRDMTYPGRDGSPAVTFDGSQRESVDMGTNNFISGIFEGGVQPRNGPGMPGPSWCGNPPPPERQG